MLKNGREIVMAISRSYSIFFFGWRLLLSLPILFAFRQLLFCNIRCVCQSIAFQSKKTMPKKHEVSLNWNQVYVRPNWVTDTSHHFSSFTYCESNGNMVFVINFQLKSVHSFWIQNAIPTCTNPHSRTQNTIEMP